MKICKNLYELSSLSKWKKQRKPTCVFPYTALLASSSSLMFAPLFSHEQRTAPEICILQLPSVMCRLYSFLGGLGGARLYGYRVSKLVSNLGTGINKLFSCSCVVVFLREKSPSCDGSRWLKVQVISQVPSCRQVRRDPCNSPSDHLNGLGASRTHRVCHGAWGGRSWQFLQIFCFS